MTRFAPIPPQVLQTFFVDRLNAAHARFRQGLLLNEEPLISNVCAEANFMGRQLVGPPQMQVNSACSILHRTGIRQTDRFGCDIAWTVRVLFGLQWLKTALFQIKMISRTEVGQSPRVDIERIQMDDANRSGFWNRAFAVAVDPDSSTAFVAPLAALSQVTNVSGRQRVNCSTAPWQPLDVWMLLWFRCQVGVQGSVSEEESFSLDRLEKSKDVPRIRVLVTTVIEPIDGPTKLNA